MVLDVTLHDQLGRFAAQLPGGRRRQGAAVERIEIAPRRQHIGTPACRRTGRAGGEEAAIEGGEQTGEFRLAAAVDIGCKKRCDKVEDAARACPAVRQHQRAGDQFLRQDFQALDRIAIRPPTACRHLRE